MSVLTVIKKIGEKVLSIVEYPFKKADQIEAILTTVDNKFPNTKAAVVETVQLLEALGEDTLSALAEKGMDIPDDLKVSADIQAFFTYVKANLFPVIDADYEALQTDLGTAPAAPAAQPAAASLPTLPNPTAAVEHVPVAAN